ncbi:hypothetical protein ACG74X_05940 [Marivita sp. S0852]|uniref:hypothetical protein n=1 Tax=Marivita sp. S0852 TaxID=3373893 RepID=UPI0039820480
MSIVSNLDVMTLFSTCLSGLAERGVSVHESSDFAQCEQRMTAIGKAGFTPMLSSDFNDLSKDHAGWLILHRDGRDIGGVAARLDSLNRESLSEFWARSYGRMYNGSGALKMSRNCDEIAGKVMYMGEFFIAKEARGSRHLLSLFTHLLFAYAALRWQPDWLYAFVRADDVRLGYASEYGFTRQYPGVHLWDKRPKGRAEGEYLVALPAGDLMRMAQFFRERPSCLLGVDSLKRVE